MDGTRDAERLVQGLAPWPQTVYAPLEATREATVKKVVAIVLVAVAITLTAVGPSDARGHGGGGHGFSGGHHGFHGGHGFHGHGRRPVIVGLGPPFLWGPYWWDYPPYTYPPTVIVEPPPVYVEPPAQRYWYYCQGASAYYPTVHGCPEGWVRVLPQP